MKCYAPAFDPQTAGEPTKCPTFTWTEAVRRSTPIPNYTCLPLLYATHSCNRIFRTAAMTARQGREQRIASIMKADDDHVLSQERKFVHR